MPSERLKQLHARVAALGEKITVLRVEHAAAPDWSPYYEPAIADLKAKQRDLLRTADALVKIARLRDNAVWLDS